MKHFNDKIQYFEHRYLKILEFITISDQEAQLGQHNDFATRLLRVITCLSGLVKRLIYRLSELERENKQLAAMLDALLQPERSRDKENSHRQLHAPASKGQAFKQKVILKPVFYILLVVALLAVVLESFFINW